MKVQQTRVTDATEGLPPIMRNKIFWIGTAIRLFIVFGNLIGYFFHFFHTIEWNFPIHTLRGFPPINIRLYFNIIGFMYFANLNVGFSIWFFFVLPLVEEGLFNHFGLGVLGR